MKEKLIQIEVLPKETAQGTTYSLLGLDQYGQVWKRTREGNWQKDPAQFEDNN